ncbi:MAG: universal stress protein [Anaerolineae bacterium]|jgi:nucleotide-binding universal stress UspA family protein|nr:universal stress protein [Anaerolineae bacterium]MBT7074043.1 universal stress protein [Anaerolineae bacterium]MBT7783368.1 universal stress protein [Anaerolineae bacterium]
MGHVSHKLNNAFEGALAGGGDPATSPLYVFGPFLKLLVLAGVSLTFGTSIWLVILTVAVVSAMYRLVMQWVTDGSGGSGLSEEEFGPWAAKINAAITFVEYTLTFLVSMAAMVTFIADRLPLLNEYVIFNIQWRTLVAIALSVVTGWLVNRGPKMAARTFGPATAGVLLLLWAMIFATIYKEGFHLPDFNFASFSSEYIGITLAGYVRILAVMTGIEVFANMVAAYDGTNEQKGKKAFNSLLIIMGTTGATMLIVGPAIKNIADPMNEHVSVFTQTMDYLLPAPLPMLGTLVGIAVLMSASAAAAQGLQNLSLGLSERRYVPPILGKRNEFQVADKPVTLQVIIVGIVFLLFGTNEETYLAIYAAGVFVLLSMTGWAVTKRLLRQVKEKFEWGKALLIFGTILAALLTTGATAIIFVERFFEGAWTYFIFIPALYAMFSYTRKRMGEPSEAMDYLGRLNATNLAGFGFGQLNPASGAVTADAATPAELRWEPAPITESKWRHQEFELSKVVVLLDGSSYAAQALPWVKMYCQKTGAHLTLLSSIKSKLADENDEFEKKFAERQVYLDGVQKELQDAGINVDVAIRSGFIADATQLLVNEKHIDIVVTSTRGKSGELNWASSGVSQKLIQKISQPVFLVQATEDGTFTPPKLGKILVPLDGSIFSERVLPYARSLAQVFDSELILLSVPAVPEPEDYSAPSELIEEIRGKAEAEMENFLDAVARSLRESNIKVRTMVKGTLPARTIVTVGKEENVDMIMSTSRGRGGLELFMVGSKAQRIVEQSEKNVFMIPIRAKLS